MLEQLPGTLHQARTTLLQQRGQHGHWQGELSSSALSTATAIVALESYRRVRAGDWSEQIVRGRAWLAQTQNPDGGWGDTTLSLSNISTTALVWAAFAAVENEYAEVVRRAADWLRHAAGSLDPQSLATAIIRRYGKDRTFSVPILTTLALTGRLGAADRAWRLIPQLPFELAACPPQWFALLRLPVVSYALPALIALGLVRHRFCPTWNPLWRLVRRLARPRVLHVLHTIQPTSGGFLEATPLTSFVVLSLVHAGEADHPVVRAGLTFLLRSVRPEGSWPIDTNLATWGTTLAVNALSLSADAESVLTEQERKVLLDWLLGQQYRVEHPYTHAAPGGWAWTDLSGGVPDADDTPGALLALRHLGSGESVRQAAQAGVTWLLDLQNRDGGIPTFCRGWGTLPFDRSSTDLTAHALRAWLAWKREMPDRLQQRIDRAVQRGLRFLDNSQRGDGAWAPLWFGNQHAPDEENLTYGTSRVLLALIPLMDGSPRLPTRASLLRAAGWLLDTQNPDGGWGGQAETPSSIEETALAVEALAVVGQSAICAAETKSRLRTALRRGVDWLIERTRQGTYFPPSPIGFYFAKLWYFERLYPMVYTVAALGRVAALSEAFWQEIEP
jgi:squalene-hopene/tetraprenyl-beta-curcumene cyclase